VAMVIDWSWSLVIGKLPNSCAKLVGVSVPQKSTKYHHTINVITSSCHHVITKSMHPMSVARTSFVVLSAVLNLSLVMLFKFHCWMSGGPRDYPLRSENLSEN
jgi:hypothetical protein